MHLTGRRSIAAFSPWYTPPISQQLWHVAAPDGTFEISPRRCAGGVSWRLAVHLSCSIGELLQLGGRNWRANRSACSRHKDAKSASAPVAKPPALGLQSHSGSRDMVTGAGWALVRVVQAPPSLEVQRADVRGIRALL